MSDKQQQFIESIAPKAQEIQRKYGVPASIAIAQAALESGWGSSAKGNNLYGIKADKSWDGAKVNMATHEFLNGANVGINDNFRAYASTEHSIENYGKFLASNGRYANVIGSDANSAADALQRAGYATDPAYASKLKNIISTYGLTRFDDPSFRGYADSDDSFERENRRLRQQRDADPKTWDDFKQSFIQLLVGIFTNAFASLGKNNAQVADNATVQPPLPTPAADPAAAKPAPTRVTSRA